MRRAIGSVVVVGLAVAGPAMVPGALAQRQGEDAKARVGLIELEGAVAERPGPLDWFAPKGGHVLMHDLVKGLESVGADPDVSGVMLRLKDAELGLTQVEEIGAAIKKARAGGKRVHVFSDAYGPTELMLGSYADEVIAQSGAPVTLPGLYTEEMFLADTLAWIGVRADMVQIGDYKGAAEQMSRNKPSPQWEENISQLLDSLYANIRVKLIAGRKLDDAKLDAAMRETWYADSDDAKRVGLVDSVVDLPRLSDHLKDSYRAPVSWREGLVSAKGKARLDMANPFAMLSMLSKKPDHTPKGPTIAVLHVDGAIVDGDSTEGGLLGGGGTVGSRTFRNAIEDILKHDAIEGVVVRINSPGGSATASEVMWQGLARLREKKKVWASVGTMAASGGYYVAVGAEKIYANPSSIVGSIGVVGGKLSLNGLYDMLKVRVYPRSRGPMASMFRSTTDWTHEELNAVKAKMTQTYDQFAGRVSAGRPGIDLGKTAEGRLFTGDKAVGLKMIDAVGGLEDAIRDLAADRSLTSYDVMHYPGPKSLEEVLEDAFKAFAKAPGAAGSAAPALPREFVAGLRALVGERNWPQVSQALEGTLQLRREPVLLITPSVLLVK